MTHEEALYKLCELEENPLNIINEIFSEENEEAEYILPNFLDGFYIKNTSSNYVRLTKEGYHVKEGHFKNRDYYSKYPFLLMHDGYIYFCDSRHLNVKNLYGKNEEIFINKGKFEYIKVLKKE